MVTRTDKVSCFNSAVSSPTFCDDDRFACGTAANVGYANVRRLTTSSSKEAEAGESDRPPGSFYNYFHFLQKSAHILWT